MTKFSKETTTKDGFKQAVIATCKNIIKDVDNITNLVFNENVASGCTISISVNPFEVVGYAVTIDKNTKSE